MIPRVNLNYLNRIETVSEIIPLYERFRFSDVANAIAEYMETELNIAVRQNVATPDFPNQRGNIDYYFYEPQYAIVIGGKIQEETALRILFFLAHGVGHAVQHMDGVQKRDYNLLVDAIQESSGSRKMEEWVEMEGRQMRYKDYFSPHEQEATQIGWVLIEKVLQTKEELRKYSEEIWFWYSLFAIVDHLYHRQFVAGPFPVQSYEWRKVFARKFEAVLMPFLLSCWTDKVFPNNSSLSKFECVYASTDGWFYYAENEVKRALEHMQSVFFQRQIDPFPRLEREVNILRFPDGKPFHIIDYNKKVRAKKHLDIITIENKKSY